MKLDEFSSAIEPPCSCGLVTKGRWFPMTTEARLPGKNNWRHFLKSKPAHG